MSEDDPDWWKFGNYTGADCANCGRERVMECEDNEGRRRLICEKCDWDQESGNYRDCGPPPTLPCEEE